MSVDPYGQYASPYVAMGNAPNMQVDPSGGWSWTTAAIGAGVGAIGGAAYALATDKKGWGWYAAGGAIAGGLIGGASFSEANHTVYYTGNDVMQSRTVSKLAFNAKGLFLTANVGKDLLRYSYAENQQRKVIDNTNQALDHYFNGDGEPAEIGKKTVKTLLDSEDFKRRHNRIMKGKTTSLNGNFSVDLTGNVFHIGRTNINYSIHCASGNCNVVYDLFVNDGFWDVDFIDEGFGKFLPLPELQPDGLGPNLERFGGTPFPYVPSTTDFSFPNPGY